jgi:hypothetical protein
MKIRVNIQMDMRRIILSIITYLMLTLPPDLDMGKETAQKRRSVVWKE